MSLASVSSPMKQAGDVRWLSRYLSMLGISLSELDYMRGHWDDFLGLVLLDQYTQATAGALSTIGLMNNVHGGRVELTAGNVVGNYAQLWLGDAADGHASIVPTEGFVMIGRWMVNTTTSIINMFGVNNAAGNRRVLARVNTIVGNNWYLVCQDGAGTTTIDSGIAFDTDYHWHVLEVNSARVRWYMDARRIAECTTNIHNAALTPVMDVQSRTTATRIMRADLWATIPR